MASDNLDQLFDQLETAIQDQRRAAFAEFVRTGALYEKHKFETIPSRFDQLSPRVLTLDCPICKRENPFRIPAPEQVFRKAPEASLHFEHTPVPGMEDDHVEQRVLQSRVYVVGLTCTGCEKFEFACWIEVDGEKGWARKVGQTPEPSIKVAPELQDALEDDVTLYRRAKICLNQSYGVGACAYLRRLLEDRITPMLEIVYEAKKENGASKDELEKIREIIQGKVATEKIDLAAGVWPPSITVDGDNPVKLVYDELSYGLHRRDEQECVRRAREAMPVIEHILTELSTERKRRQSKRLFIDKVRSIRNSSSAPQ